MLRSRTAFFVSLATIAIIGAGVIAPIVAQAQQQLPPAESRIRIDPRIFQQQAPVNPRDRDGDGVQNAESGGTDCNDDDADVYPGNAERPDQKDQDCNPSTFGMRDEDRDGFVDVSVFNVAPNGERFGGDDCNDREPAINRLAQELPNGVDDNCDGQIDNLLGRWFTPSR